MYCWTLRGGLPHAFRKCDQDWGPEIADIEKMATYKAMGHIL